MGETISTTKKAPSCVPSSTKHGGECQSDRHTSRKTVSISKRTQENISDPRTDPQTGRQVDRQAQPPEQRGRRKVPPPCTHTRLLSSMPPSPPGTRHPPQPCRHVLAAAHEPRDLSSRPGRPRGGHGTKRRHWRMVSFFQRRDLAGNWSGVCVCVYVCGNEVLAFIV